MDLVTILVGDCREMLRTLPAESVQTCVTSPPYWGLRDYGVEGQLGMEETPEQFVDGMVEVFREVGRVLKPDGTLWLNIGDSYARNGGEPGGGNREMMHMEGKQKRMSSIPRGCGLKPKDLVGVPWMLAFALRADGWYLRSEIIWHKPAPMPESVTDRPTKSHEQIFLLTKRESYFYDAEAIKEPCSPDTHARYARGRSGDQTLARSLDHMVRPTDDGPDMFGVIPPPHEPDSFHGSVPGRKDGPGQDRRSEKPRTRKHAENGSGTKNNASFDAAMAVMPETRNKRSVWTVNTYPYSEAHFATFPPDLIRPCILAGSRVGDVVLDPFGGSGTTGQVAVEEGRRAILCELNPSYAELARIRTNTTPGLGI